MQRFVYVFHQNPKELMFFENIFWNLKQLIVQRFFIKKKHVKGQNQRADTPADFILLSLECQKHPPEVPYKKAVPGNFAIFTGKQLCWGLFLIKLQAFRRATS